MTHPAYHVIAPACNHPAASQAESLGSAVWLWIHASNHSKQPVLALEHTLLPAIRLGQYVLVIEKVPDTGTLRPVAYLAWANLSAQAEARYVQNPFTGLTRDDWNSGDRMWITDYVAPFGHAAKLTSICKQLLCDTSGRYMYHRSNERGVQIRKFVGARVSPADARQWLAQRPILAIPHLL